MTDDKGENHGPENAAQPIIGGTEKPVYEIGTFQVYGDPAKLFKAVQTAQASFNRLRDTKEGYHGNEYVPLEPILEEVMPKLRDEGFCFMQPPCSIGDETHLGLVLGHEDGDMIVTTARVPEETDMQDWGSNLTYTARYMVAKFLGLTTMEDDDARHAAQNRAQNPTGSDRETGKDKKKLVVPNGYPHRDTLKDLGFRFSESNKAWWLETTEVEKFSGILDEEGIEHEVK